VDAKWIGLLALAVLYCGLGLGIAGATWGSSDDLTKGYTKGNGMSLRTELELVLGPAGRTCIG